MELPEPIYSIPEPCEDCSADACPGVPERHYCGAWTKWATSTMDEWRQHRLLDFWRAVVGKKPLYVLDEYGGT